MIRTGKLMIAVFMAGGGFLSSLAAADSTNLLDATASELKRVSDAGKYAFVLFDSKDTELAAVREAIKKAVEDSKGRAEAIEVNVSDPARAATVQKYGVDRAPLPLVLAIAPNGAVTGGFPGTCEPQALAEAMVGPKAAACLRTLQDGKVVLICMQPAGSKGAEATLKTVEAFKADQRISGFAESVVIDPVEQAEEGFLAKLRLDPKSQVETMLLVVPPGRIAGTYTNAVTSEVLFSDLARSMAGSTCGGGGGCGPVSGGCR